MSFGGSRHSVGVGGPDGGAVDGAVRLDGLAAAEPPRLRDLGNVASVVDRCRLDRRTGGSEFVLGRDQDGTSGEVSDDTSVGGTTGSTADEKDGTVCRLGAESVSPGEQI